MLDAETYRELIERLDARYRKIEDCDNEHQTIYNKLSNDDKRIAVIETKLTFNNWLSTAIAVGVIALVIKMFLGG